MAKPFDLAIGEWWQVPRVGNSQLADVYPTNPGGNQAAIISAWSGACVDTSRKDLLVWGGGHADYTGNEVYAFNFDSGSGNYLTWRRKTFPSTPLNNDAEQNADGSPASRHTYSGLNYHPSRDTMVVAAGGFLAGAGGVRSLVAWEFACTTESPNSAAPSAWTQKDTAPTIAPNGTPEPFMSMAYDATANKFYSQHNRGFTSFDPAASAGTQWTELTNFEGPAVADNTCAIAQAPTSPRQIIWPSVTDSGEAFGRRLDTNAYIGTETTGLPASGSINILDVADPGLLWEPNLLNMLLWGGTATGGTDNRDVYKLNLSTKAITRVAGTGDIPSAPTANGTFGRFAYLGGCGASYDGLCCLVNSTTGHVYFYRSSGTPISDPQPPSATPIGRRFIGWTA